VKLKHARHAFVIVIAVAIVAEWMIWPNTTLSHVTTTNTVLFDREIVSVLDAHCVACHAPGGIASSMETYEETWLGRVPVLREVLARHMPPWAAVPGYGKFSNDNSLTLRETQFIVSWVEGLGPRNDGAVFLNVRDAGDVPDIVQASADSDLWILGEPDLIGELDQTVVRPGQGERIERVTLDLGLDSQRWVQGIEFLPGDRRVVRAATFRVEGTGQWLGSWTPWHGYVDLPADVAYDLEAGTRVVAEIYYGTSNERVVDQGRLGLHFVGDDAGTVVRVSDMVLEARGGLLPGARNQRFAVESEAIDSDIAVLSLLPEFEPGITSIEVSARTPDGGTKILLFATDIPIDWPTPYILSDPVILPAGSSLRVVAYYDNDSDLPPTAGIRLTVSRHEL
jgi:hypothetical protein